MEENRHGFKMKIFRKHLLPDCPSINIEAGCEHNRLTKSTLESFLNIYINQSWVDRIEIDILKWKNEES